MYMYSTYTHASDSLSTTDGGNACTSEITTGSVGWQNFTASTDIPPQDTRAVNVVISIYVYHIQDILYTVQMLHTMYIKTYCTITII